MKLCWITCKLFPRTPPFAANVIYQLQRMNENSNAPLRVKRSKKAPQKINNIIKRHTICKIVQSVMIRR